MDIVELRGRADAGSVVAQSIWGLCYLLRGRCGCRPDQFFAQIELARLFADGLGVPSDWNAAAEWYSKAIANGQDLGDCEELAEAIAYVASKP